MVFIYTNKSSQFFLLNNLDLIKDKPPLPGGND